MKTRIFQFVIIVICVLFVFSGCGNKHYSAYKSMLSELISAKEKFINETQAAPSAEALANAIKEYTKNLESFKTKKTDLIMKYPQLTDRGPHPDDVVKLIERSEALDEKIDSTLIPAMEKYPNDANLISAWNELLLIRTSL